MIKRNYQITTQIIKQHRPMNQIDEADCKKELNSEKGNPKEEMDRTLPEDTEMGHRGGHKSIT